MPDSDLSLHYLSYPPGLTFKIKKDEGFVNQRLLPVINQALKFQLMSHRLQHLNKRKIEPADTNSQKEASEITNGGTPSQQNRQSLYTPNTRPIFPPTTTIYSYNKNDYKKGQKAFPPPESLYIAKDTQVDPCFLRTTTMALHNLPRKNGLPIAVWITPFASDRVSVIEVKAPLRCSGCKTYVNPYFQFDGTRRAATCNLCGLRFPIEEGIDKANLQSAEIATQSVIDFRVSEKIYFKKRTDIIKILALVELSMNTLQLGVFFTVLASLKSAFQSQQFEEKVRIGITFYNDQGVGYLQRGQQGQQPVILIVPNNKSSTSYCPLSQEEMLFDPINQLQQLIASLDFLESYGNSFWKKGKFSHSASYTHALKSIKECFEQQTGKVLLFSCLDPRWGSCAVRNRSEEQQKMPLKPLNMEIYELGRQLLRSRVGVEHFYFSKDNLISHEIATTHFLASLTGGELHLYNNYCNESANVLYYHIFHALTRPTYFDADFTCRVSPGLNVLRYGVPEGMREGRDISLSTMTKNSSFLVQIQQQEKLEELKGAFVQFALLYTTARGQRRIRVINFRFDVTSRLETLYDSIDYLTLANIMAKNQSQRILKADVLRIRQDAIGWLALLISEFQSKCQQALSAKVGGVIVPEGMAWALYYLHSVLSSQLFSKNQRPNEDGRVNQYLKLQAYTPYFFASHYYPRLYPLTLDIYDEEPLPGDFLESENGDEQRIAVLPSTLPLTRGSLTESGVYLYDGCDQLVIVVQPQAGEELLLDLFGTTNWEELQAQGLPELETAHNIRVNNIVSEVRRRNSQQGGMYQPLTVKTPLKKKKYADFVASILKEDNLEHGFPEFMELIRRAVNASK